MADAPDEELLPETEVEGEEQETEEETEESEEAETEEETEESSDEESKASSTGNASQSRRESRNARQARENRELREKLARTQGELEAVSRTAKPPVDPEAARRQRDEQLALMSPEERARFEDRETIQNLQNQGRQTQFLLADMNDKNSFGLLCNQDPVAKKYAGEVEELLAEMRRSGSTAPRETLLNYIIGKHARDAAKKGGTKKQVQQRRDEAAIRTAQAKGKSMSARGDAGGKGSSGESVDDLRQRLLAREARGDMN